ncbi:acid phosphatase-domain-containing protein [Cristinia sonorae]|uniref:Acid phosphatase-domain-containing protein n=1 Tax=Cristinia sonorae TaxID=1940300 RepID=A0A8K0V0D3_9AGAR|nr:acid phosphatase-domain-containing protein [Cristinia sonorae]
MSYPKVVALDTDWTLFWGWLNANQLGKGFNPAFPAEENLEPENGSEWVLRDRTNHGVRIGMYEDIPNIIYDILSHGAKLAIVSRNSSKAACDKALWWFKATDPRDNQKKSIIDMVDFDEVYNADKTTHFMRIQQWTGFDFSDMILFDDEATNNLVRIQLGVTFQVSRNQTGLTWANYQDGLNQWRHVQAIRSPYLGQSLGSYPCPMFLGYSGMDEQTVKLLIQGKNRTDLTESARWGYAMYIADDINIAKFFANWIKADAFGQNTNTYVCEIWARDARKFIAMNKIWFPENGAMMTDNKHKSAFEVAWSQENRDARAASWGVSTPYILFSRHHWMQGMPVPWGQRWNEMAVYTQVQNALLLTIPLSDQDVKRKAAMGGKLSPFEKQIRSWNITVPQETLNDSTAHGEWNIFR